MALRILLLLLLSGGVAAQSPLLDRIAGEICACMTAAGPAAARPAANRCLREAAVAHATALGAEFDLRADLLADRRRLGDLLVDRLTADCPVLQTLDPGAGEAPPRFRDFPAAEVVPGSVSRNPPPDPPGTTTAEAPAVWRATGTLVERPGPRELQLRTPAGEVLTFSLPPRLLRNQRFSRGDRISLTYRRAWQKGGDRILREILTFSRN